MLGGWLRKLLTDDKSSETLKDKDPGPASLSSNAIHLRDTTSQETTESTSKSSSREEQSHPVTAFMTPIPHGDVERHTGKQTAFSNTEGHTSNEQARVIVDQTHESHNNTPCHHNDCQPQGWAGSLHHHVTGNLRGDIPWEEDGQRNLEEQHISVVITDQCRQSGTNIIVQTFHPKIFF